ncbi:acyl carrier protein [Paenibacillus sp. FJAT-26967]|uniref:acyl carrier protein n=1 Tax=Paenibacillus sp. FJAT-26967 TaxID=1729690 RepID=UPI00083826D0|nr:acyl carrier protein [Paenibacillus sp. FJAT-26967]
MSVKKQVCVLLSDQGCGVLPVDEIGEDMGLFEIGFDSLRYMEFIVLLEEHYGIQWPDDALEISSATKVKDMVGVLEGCL